MKTIEVTSLPDVFFSIINQHDSYDFVLNPLHRCIEITYIAQGTLDFWIDKKKRQAHQGDVMCIIRNKEIVVHSDEPICLHSFIMRLDYTYQENNANGLYLPFVTRFNPQMKNLHNMIDDIIYNFHQYKQSSARQIAQVMNILCEIDTINHVKKLKQIPGEVLLTEKAKKYIQKHIYKPITQHAVAEHLKITPEYLCRIFKKIHGDSLMKYVNKTKLEGIKNLMASENIHLYEAALIFGYKDANYVSSLHKKLFGYNITEKPPKDFFK